jgi:hypothetical protein
MYSITGQKIVDFAADDNSTMVITATGQRYGIGTNTANKLGDGSTAAAPVNKTAWTSLPSSPAVPNFHPVKVFSTDTVTAGNAYYYITKTGEAWLSGYNNNNRAMGVVTGNINTPAKMGSGGYQGYVIDIRVYTNSSVIHTSQGTVWSCTNGTGNSYAEHGWGINSVATTGTGLNVFKQVPVPGTVVALQSASESTYNSATYTVLNTEGRVYNWGGVAAAFDVVYKYAPAEVPTACYKSTGKPKDNSQLDYSLLTPSVLTITGATANYNFNGLTNTVTFTLPYTGTPGIMDTSFWTLTGTGVTVTNIQNPVVILSTSGKITFTATVSSTTDSALLPGGTQPQEYTIAIGAVSATIAGTRVQDQIAKSLSTSFAAYANANSGAWVPIEATEYAVLKANISTAPNQIAGAADAGMNGTTAAIALANTTWGNVSSFGYVAANSFPYALQFTPGQALAAFKFQPKVTSSIAGLNTYKDVGSTITTSTTAGGKKYFVLKGASFKAASTAPNHLGFYSSGNMNGFTPTYTMNTATGNVDTVVTAGTRNTPAVQMLTASSKQW